MLNKLSNLHKKCFPKKPWSADDFSDLKKSGCEIIGSDNGFIVWRTAADEAELITIGVNPDAHGTGIATAMLGIMEGELKKSDVKKMFLEVAVDNISAMNLYKKYGFAQVGIRPKYYDGMDAIIMEKII